MSLDPLRRFSSRAEDYARYRPSYPDAVIDVLRRDCGLSDRSTVADIGSGTGLLAKLFLNLRCTVFGVEPNAEMRRAGESFLAGYGRFRSVAAQAEATTLPARSIDLVTAGQAFHWFDPPRARAEFARILRDPRWVALVWNERRVTGDPFLEGYEALLQRYAPEYGRVDHRRIGDLELSDFFGHTAWKKAVFENQQRFDLDGVRGRLLSSSYVPAGNDTLMRELERLFAATARDGHVAFAYETRLHYGALNFSSPST